PLVRVRRAGARNDFSAQAIREAARESIQAWPARECCTWFREHSAARLPTVSRGEIEWRQPQALCCFRLVESGRRLPPSWDPSSEFVRRADLSGEGAQAAAWARDRLGRKTPAAFAAALFTAAKIADTTA